MGNAILRMQETPQTEPDGNHGYDNYDEKFKNEYIDCIGNYLLVSKSHNCAVGNKTFEEKLATYNKSNQQREIVNFISSNKKWDKEAIQKRHKKILEFIRNNYGCKEN